MQIEHKDIPVGYRVYVADKPDRDGTWQVEIYNPQLKLIQVKWVDYRNDALDCALLYLDKLKNEGAI